MNYKDITENVEIIKNKINVVKHEAKECINDSDFETLNSLIVEIKKLDEELFYLLNTELKYNY